MKTFEFKPSRTNNCKTEKFINSFPATSVALAASRNQVQISAAIWAMDLFVVAARYRIARRAWLRRQALFAAWRMVARAELALADARWRCAAPLRRRVARRLLVPPRRRVARRLLQRWWFEAQFGAHRRWHVNWTTSPSAATLAHVGGFPRLVAPPQRPLGA